MNFLRVSWLRITVLIVLSAVAVSTCVAVLVPSPPQAIQEATEGEPQVVEGPAEREARKKRRDAHRKEVAPERQARRQAFWSSVAGWAHTLFVGAPIAAAEAVIAFVLKFCAWLVVGIVVLTAGIIAYRLRKEVV